MDFMDKVQIGGISLRGNVVLGPMAGVTTLAYREFMKPFGVALSFSEMISDCGLDYGNKKTKEYFRTSLIDRPVGLQLFGFKAENTLKAIEVLEENADYDLLDINLGCPVYKVVKTGAGSAWLKDPKALYLYMRAVCEKSHKPVTAKIRLGWDSPSINVLEVSSLLEKAGVQMLTVHARTSRQGYAGQADFSKIAGLGKKLSIPLCVSGDILTPEKAIGAMKEADASLVMVARGGLGNPRLVTNIQNLLDEKELLPFPTVLEQAEWAEEFSKKLIENEGARVAVMQLRGLIPHFFSGFPGYKKIRGEISLNIKTYEDLMAILEGIKNRERL
jgi:nifR3 family TIM-barrel protein